MTVHIIGAGMAGLLAANMLRHRDPIVYEIQPSLPNNHSAVLRFRTSAVGDVLNIPFKKVQMIKDHLPWRNVVADALAYSFKNTGNYTSDRSITAGQTIAERWIAPQDLIARMAEKLDIRYGTTFNIIKASAFYGAKEPVISTLHMGVLAEDLNYNGWQGSPVFESTPGANIKANIANCDAYVSLLVPDPEYPFSRISITGNEMIIEMPNNSVPFIEANILSITFSAASLLGIDKMQVSSARAFGQRYAKIIPIDDDNRKSFMHWATVTHNVYSLGRYATWRPKLLLDDLVSDIRKIDKWISSASKYDTARDR